MKIRLTRSGFTLVELMVAIAILSILTALTAFAFRGWQSGIDQRQLQSDLRAAAVAMESAKNFGSGYPLALPTTFKQGDNSTVVWSWGDGSQFCLQGTSKRNTSLIYNVRNGQGNDPQPGSCPSSPLLPGAPSPTATAGSSTTIIVTWANVTGATSYVVKYGTTSPTTTASCTSSPCTISGLTASTVYNVSVAGANTNGTGPAGTTFATTQAPPVAPPSAPTIASVGVQYNYAIISWSSVSGASSYEVEYKLSSTSTWGNTVSKTTVSHQYNGLSLGVTLNFRVRAINSSGASAWSPTVTRVTIPTPTNLNVTIDSGNAGCGNTGGNTAWANGTITWNGASNTYATQYQVYSLRNSPGTNAYITNNYTSSGGAFSYAGSSGGWDPQGSAAPLFEVTGIGPNGERSNPASWTGPQYPAGNC